MKKTKKKIILNAIELFNKNGYNSVRLEDIAIKAAMSKGNLHYHFPTKKEILEGVLGYLQEERVRLIQTSQDDLAIDFNLVSIIQRYLHFQFTYRFFYTLLRQNLSRPFGKMTELDTIKSPKVGVNCESY